MSSSSKGKESVRLCEHIVRQAFGEIVCRVASTLLHRGRQQIASIAHLSALTRTQTLASLIILIQHNLVQSSGDGYYGVEGKESYEFNVRECLLRLRWGRMLGIIGERMGGEAVEVLRHIMLYGKIKIEDIMKHCSGNNDARHTIYNDVISNMLQSRFIEPTVPELQILESDEVARRFRFNRSERQKTVSSTLLSSQQLAECQNDAEVTIRTKRADLRAFPNAFVKTVKTSSKTKSKHRQTEEEYDYVLKPSCHLQIAYDRFGVIMRDELIVGAARERWNEPASEIIKAYLKHALRAETSLSDMRTEPAATLKEIVDKIPGDKDTRTKIVTGIIGRGSSSWGKNLLDVTREYLYVMSGADAVGFAVKDAFVGQDETGTDNGWYVMTERVCMRMRESMLIQLVREKLGGNAARVLACFSGGKKLLEMGIRDMAMMKIKDVRSNLAHLRRLGILETQEVPKGPQNAKMRAALGASGEVHFWSLIPDRAYQVLLESIYKTLANILQRKALEGDRFLAVRARAARVGGRREELGVKDQEDLRDWDEGVRKLSLAEMRCELVVFVLRDLPGGTG